MSQVEKLKYELEIAKIDFVILRRRGQKKERKRSAERLYKRSMNHLR